MKIFLPIVILFFAIVSAFGTHFLTKDLPKDKDSIPAESVPEAVEELPVGELFRPVPEVESGGEAEVAALSPGAAWEEAKAILAWVFVAFVIGWNVIKILHPFRKVILGLIWLFFFALFFLVQTSWFSLVFDPFALIDSGRVMLVNASLIKISILVAFALGIWMKFWNLTHRNEREDNASNLTRLVRKFA